MKGCIVVAPRATYRAHLTSPGAAIVVVHVQWARLHGGLACVNYRAAEGDPSSWSMGEEREKEIGKEREIYKHEEREIGGRLNQ